MSDKVIEHTTIEANPDRVMEVLLDFPRYPDWAKDLKAVEVLETDELGRGTSVRYRAAGFGRSVSYVLAYDHSDPARVAWKLTQGDIMRKLDGYYELAGEDGTTAVTYQLEADLIVPIPGFVKNRTQGRIMHTALHDLKRRVESLGS